MPDENGTPHDKEAGPRSMKYYLWPAVVVALLGGHITICLVAVALATGDPSVAIEPDYYQKAVDWDKTQLAKLASDQLGWSTLLTVSPESDPLGNRLVKVIINDPMGQPVTGLLCDMMLYHRARSNDRQSLQLSESESGVYIGKSPIRREGFWEFRLVANRFDQNYLWEESQFVLKPEK